MADARHERLVDALRFARTVLPCVGGSHARSETRQDAGSHPLNGLCERVDDDCGVTGTDAPERS